jgi:hypothetical protein
MGPAADPANAAAIGYIRSQITATTPDLPLMDASETMPGADTRRLLRGGALAIDPRPLGVSIGSDDASGSPLSGAEAARVRRVGRRLREALRAVVLSLPEGDRGGSRMARRLGIDRSICQRVLNAIRPAEDEAVVPVRAPGVQGLETFLSAMRAQGMRRDALAGAEAAVEEFAKLIDDLAGSQAHLGRRIEATATDDDEPSGARSAVRAREQAFRAGAELLGHAAETHVQVGAYAPAPGNPDAMLAARLRGYHRFVARRGATPLVIRSGAVTTTGDGQRDETLALDGSPLEGRSSDGVLGPFSTQPLPLVTSRGARGSMLQLIDYPAGVESDPVDVFVAHRWANAWAHPRTESPPIEESWSFSQHPSRRLVFDVFLHERLARECIPSLGAFLMSPVMSASIGERWMDRIADAPPLRVLPRDLEQAGTPAYARHVELLQHFFAGLGWDPAHFVGYRCEVEFPIWGAGYCMTFDFSSPEE